MAPNYGNGKIYKIVNGIDNEIYVGSTINTLAKRMDQHRKKIGVRKSKLYTKMNNLGIDNFRIILIEMYPCNNRDELTAREQALIDQLKPVLNTRSAAFAVAIPKVDPRTLFDNYDEASEKDKCKMYAQANKDYMKICVRAYCEKNKDAINAKRSEVIHCACGREVTQRHISRHEKSKAHTDWQHQQAIAADN